MKLDELAKRLSDGSRIGLTPDLLDRLRVRPQDATRGQLMAELDGDDGHLGVYLLGAYVVQDTDAWGDGEVYWWSIPTLIDKSGQASWSPLSGLPTGGKPHKVGSLEWMTNFSLQELPLLAVLPPSEDLAACALRVGFYDDDGEVADVPRALTAGLEALASVSTAPLSSPDQIIGPVRQAILKSLNAEEDDILIDQDIVLRRGEFTRFNAGLIGSEMKAFVRLFYIVFDENKTEQLGPITLRKGQTERIKFNQPLQGGGKLALFARGADVHSASFGDITTDTPFLNRVIDSRGLAGLAEGFEVVGRGPAKLVAFYTPPRP